MSGGHRFNKKFNSLEKRGLGGSVHPINNLRSTNNNQKASSSPKGSRITVKNQLTDIFDHQVNNSKSLRERLEKKLQEHDTVDESDDSDNNSARKERCTRRIKTVSGKHFYTMVGDIDENLREMLVVRSMLLNGDVTQQAQFGDLVLRVSTDNEFLFFTKNGKTVAAISRDHEFKSINFSINKRAVLIELIKWGYIYVKYTEDDNNILSYFLRNKDWNVNTPTRVVNDLLLEKIGIIKQKKDDHSIIKPDIKNAQTTANRPPSISPDIMYGRTRSSSRVSEHSLSSRSANSVSARPLSIYDEDLVKPGLVPKLFDIELKYVFLDKKMFTITYSDFKTLYDNDWINDSLIEFFIKYEMDKAIYQKNLFKPNDVYAFNSFFFTKLMSGDEFDGPIDHYGNIKRWLNKLDLMSYPNIIIPINENLHWYCCLIKGLPQLLETSLKRREATQLELIDLHEDTLTTQNEGGDDQENSAEDTIDAKKKTKELAMMVKKTYQPEIFIFDSLRQKHTNIYFPLKKFIIDYCKEKYDVDIGKNEIRMHSAKVPKQNNFNDCGIHVIYNVRKWLNNSEECERIWRSSQLRSASRLLFIAEERNGMRRELRNILLNLKEKQLTEQVETPSFENSDNADDDIEVIEYTPVISNRSIKLPVLNEELNNKANVSQDSSKNATPERKMSLESSYTARTLDPKARSKPHLEPSSNTELEYSGPCSPEKKQIKIKNKMLTDELSGFDLSNTFQDVINDYFSKNEKIGNLQLQRVLQLRNEINDLDDIKDCSLITKHISDFINDSEVIRETEHDKAMRPKDEDLVIMHCSDNEELNRSVNGLKLSNASDNMKYNDSPIGKSRRNSTTGFPEHNPLMHSNVPELKNVDSIEELSPDRFNRITNAEKISNPSYIQIQEDLPTADDVYTISNDRYRDDIQSGLHMNGKPSQRNSPKTYTPKTILFTDGSTLKRRKLDNDKHTEI